MTERVPRVSVVVCTRNRSSRLGDASAALLAVTPPAGGFEVVIVDNASTDDTRAVADRVQRDAGHLVRVVEERTIGLSAARNRGIAESRGELIAFLDDDAFPNPLWLEALATALGGDRVLCAGGPVEPLVEGELPEWFQGRFLPYLTVWDLGDEATELRYNEYPRGANMAFRREAFDRFGGFSPHLGRSGRSLLSCEETELCLRLERGGFRTVYAPEARVRHSTPVDRLTPAWMERRFAAQGRSEAIIAWMHGGLRGIARGLVDHRSRAREADRQRCAVGELFAQCQRRALRGYIAGVATAPFGIPRYRPPSSEVALHPWP
jgi:glycosyltransferase involved in cell wall biosynthesis